MENLIEFMDFKSVGGRRRLEENMFSVWYNLDGDTKNYGCTFSNNIKTEKNRIKIGKIAGDLCFVFSNDESGIVPLPCWPISLRASLEVVSCVPLPRCCRRPWWWRLVRRARRQIMHADRWRCGAS